MGAQIRIAPIAQAGLTLVLQGQGNTAIAIQFEYLPKTRSPNPVSWAVNPSQFFVYRRTSLEIVDIWINTERSKLLGKTIDFLSFYFSVLSFQ